MNNREIARLLRQVAAAYRLKEENRFKIIAYEKAAESIEKSVVDVKDLWKEGKLNAISGIGSAIASYLDELFQKGKVRHFEDVLKEFPKALFPLLDVPTFGPKKAYKLVTKLKLRDPESVYSDLLKAARAGKIAPLEGFGEKSQQDIIEALEQFEKGQGKEERMSLPKAHAIASDVVTYLRECKSALEVLPLGSLRRKVSTIGDIDLAVSTKNPKVVIDYFLQYPKKKKIIEKGLRGATILLENDTQIDLRVQHPKSFGSMLQYFTGSKNHNIHLREFALKKGLSLSEYGIKPVRKIKNARLKMQNYLPAQTGNSKLKIYEYSDEVKFYNALGLPWIPPELREDRGEIEAAIREGLHGERSRTAHGKHRGLPLLISHDDIKGDFHIHSNYNLESSHDMGLSSVEEIVQMASRLGYEYVAISDHNPSRTNHSSDAILRILKDRKYTFEQKMKSIKSTRVQIFLMLEVDILPDGKLAIPDESFEYLDAVIVSIHSSFKMKKDQMTERIISGLSHPRAKIFAHPTGRVIGKRRGYEVDWARLFNFCKVNSKAIEINSFPDRLDLSDILVREAIKNGIKLTIGTDSHEASQMENMHFGVSVARRGWATTSDILNALPYNKLKEWLTDRQRQK